MSISQQVSARINRMRKGVPFELSGFYKLGTPGAVQQAMSRLAKEGTIVRVSKGIYARPRPLKLLPSISVTTSAELLAKVWAKKFGYKIAHHGMEDAYRLGLQTQAPLSTIYWTNGPSKEISVGKEVIKLLPFPNVERTTLIFSATPEGAFYRSFTVLEPESVSPTQVVGAIKRLSLSTEQAENVIYKLKKILLNQKWSQLLGEAENELSKS